eukprot:10095843-Alexandrium_andersonii.AAC.1
MSCVLHGCTRVRAVMQVVDAQDCVPHAEAAFADDARRTCTPALAPLSRAKAFVRACVRACARACVRARAR